MYSIIKTNNTEIYMKLSNINMNLLNALHELLKEQSVTRAAKNLSLSQPQVSSILKELRIIFDDEILSKGPRNRLIITEKGRHLIKPVSEAIDKCKQVFSDEIEFDPLRAEVNYKVGLNDYASNLIVPDLACIINNETNHVSLNIQNTNDLSDFDLLYSENIDLLVGFWDIFSGSVSSEELFKSRFSCLVSNNHPLSGKGKISKSDILKYPFVQLKQGKQYWEQEAEFFIEESIKGKRKVVCSLPHIFSVMEALGNDYFMCITHKILAEKYGKFFNIKALELPFNLRTPVYSMYWKKVDDLNKENIWLRNKVKETVKGCSYI